VVPRLTSDGLGAELTFPQRKISTPRWILHWLLLGLSLLTATMAGVVLMQSFERNRPLSLEQYINLVPTLYAHPFLLTEGLAFSITLMTILLAHELGHYFMCRYYGIDASLPYFLPAPTPIGTLGAFIRIRSPIYSRRALFDVGIAGPIAGFIVLIPLLVIGIANSKVVPGIGQRGDLIFGVPAIERIIEWLIFPGVPASDIYLHPIARGAWVGILATALNLLPIGQLDGGHIVYSFIGQMHKPLSRVLVAALVPLGLLYSRSWLVWAVLLFFFGLRHPMIYDATKLDRTRVMLGFAALAMFLLTFMLVPLK
jgi:membrane-associated protease RseP (regulator of RpoE activity)